MMNAELKATLEAVAEKLVLNGEPTTAEALWQELVTYQAETDDLDMEDETIQDYTQYAVMQAFDFVLRGDEFPTNRISDLITLQATTSSDWWKPIFEANLNTQAWILDRTQAVKDMSNIVFGAVVDTAFSFVME